MHDDSADLWLYEYSKQRYVLGKPGDNPLICFGVNPSTAEPGDDNLDPTMKMVRKIVSERSNHTGYIMLNLYPQCTTDPDGLHDESSSFVDIFIDENLKYIESVLSKYDTKLWACWGALIEKREYLKSSIYRINELAKKYNRKWVTIGKTTSAGHPHHPLYIELEENERFRDFYMDDYLTKIQAR